MCSTYEFLCDHVCFCVNVYLLFICIYILSLCGSIFHIWEKICSLGLGLSEPGLLHLTWCPPVASVNLQTRWCHFPYWWVKLNCVYEYMGTHTYTHIYIWYCGKHQHTCVSIVSQLKFLWIYAHKCYHCIIWQLYLYHFEESPQCFP
jgi:hypothetical protein